MRPQLLTALVLSTLLAPVAWSDTAGDYPTGFTAPRGKFYTLETHRMHMVCRGDGSPTVLFESGLGGSADDWADLQTTLGDSFRTCAYDRAGYGWSDPGPLPRTTTQIVDELRLLLEEAGEPGPYVLVGHSFGGLVVQEFASRYPDDTAGMVLVESSHPEQEQRLGPLLTGGTSNSRNPIRMPDKSAGPGCRANAEQTSFLNSRRKAVFAQMQELKHFASSGAAVAALPAPDRVPSVVLTRGRREAPAGPQGDRAEAAWAELQADLATRVGAVAHRVGAESGHNLHLCEPELVQSAIRDVAARRVAGRD